jgi:hypothetical protein
VWQGSTAIVQGQLRRARVIRRFIEVTTAKGAAATVAAALGQCRAGAGDRRKALQLAHSDAVLLNVGFASAVCGDANTAVLAFDELAKLYPKNTTINGTFIPNFRALPGRPHKPGGTARP